MQGAQQGAAERDSQFLNKNVPRPVIPPIETLEPASKGYVPRREETSEDDEELPPGAAYGDGDD
jgi:hypothetical protein